MAGPFAMASRQWDAQVLDLLQIDAVPPSSGVRILLAGRRA
jgi:hypothetical protein